MICIGIDPGKSSGAIAVLLNDEIQFLRLSKSTDKDVCVFLNMMKIAECIQQEPIYCVIEKLSNMGPPMNGRPGRGSKSNWSLSGSYHGLKMALTCLEIPFEEVTASKWMSYLNCRTRGDKRVSQQRAKQLFPEEKCFQWQADALLLAQYAKLYV